MANQEKDLRLAVLIDADNAPRTALVDIMAEVAVYGAPTIKRIYGDWTAPNMESWKPLLLQHAITPIQQYAYTTGKNSTDSAMIIDAMDILYSGKVDGFCLVSSDSDFTRLATRLREAGMKVIGIGEKKTPNPFIVACDKFVYIEIISQNNKPLPQSSGKNSKPKKPEAPQTGIPPECSAEITPLIASLIAATIDDVADDDGWAYLGELGSLLIKKAPDFDPRNFGYKKLTLMMEAMDSVEVDYRQNVQENNGKLIYIRNKARD